ncbi:MAG: DNA polymerase III subunit gamma/tau [bacterium]|nr:DNA polymerase III subunit gamma/tau [bacterium]
MYQVLARKWRPRNFDELVGQRHVTRTLANAIAEDRLAHAYIFAGLRGTGKTTVARILAKCLNCESGPTKAPCDSCASCEEVAQSRSMDVLEIDAASRTKVEQTRELLEMVNYAPVRDRFKVLIIDEAHMLSKASFNALLKTLEEPPPNVLFILATTEVQKILPTIQSRCQVFEFRRVASGELVEHLRRIADTEKIEITDYALDRVARAGQGSVRDSLSVLERVLAFCGNKVEDDDVLRILGGVRIEVLSELLRGLTARDAGTMLRVLDGLVAEGHDLMHFWTEVIGAVRDLMLLGAVKDAGDLVSRSPEEAQALVAAAEGLSREDLTRTFQVLSDLEGPLKMSGQPRYMFESALIRLADLGAVKPIEEVLSRLSGAPLPAPAAEKKNPAAVARPAPAAGARTAPPAAPAPPAAAAPAPPPEAEPAPPPVSMGGFGGDLVSSILEAKPMLGALLEQATSIRLTGDDVVVAFAGNETLAKPLQRDENLAVVRKHAMQLVGRQVKVRVDNHDAPAESAGAETGASDARRDSPKPPPKRRGALLEDARNEPAVRKLLHEFGAQVVDIRPLEPSRTAPEPAPDPGPMEEPR